MYVGMYVCTKPRKFKLSCFTDCTRHASASALRPGSDAVPYMSRIEFNELSSCEVRRLRPGSDAVLHMSRIEFNELSSCEVRRLNQLETADIIRIDSAVLHA